MKHAGKLSDARSADKGAADQLGLIDLDSQNRRACLDSPGVLRRAVIVYSGFPWLGIGQALARAVTALGIRSLGRQIVRLPQPDVIAAGRAGSRTQQPWAGCPAPIGNRLVQIDAKLEF
jgi:hypothetical protein